MYNSYQEVLCKIAVFKNPQEKSCSCNGYILKCEGNTLLPHCDGQLLDILVTHLLANIQGVLHKYRKAHIIWNTGIGQRLQ